MRAFCLSHLISPHLIYSLSPHSLKFSYFLSNLIFCLALLSIPPHLSRLVPFKIVEASKTVVIIRINPFVNRFIQFNLRWWQKMSYFSSLLVNLSCFYRVFFKFRHLARVFFKIEWMFSAWLTFSSRFLYTDSQISIKKERSGFAPLFETVQNAIKFW